MAIRRPQLAKLTRPRLHKAVARERLFSLLDEAREHKPAICVIGPPGAGKTTLVASWLDARGIKGIWYQVDAGDADLATFFYYLGEAAKPYTCKGLRPLPLLTPEYLHDVERFSRRFFRELFSRLPDEATLVLDNYQDVDSGEQFHQLLAQAMDEVPEGKMLIVLSRRDPPDCYVRLVANEGVALLDWTDLKLTLQEVDSVCALRQPLSPDEIGRLHQLSEGWAAGLMLILEGLRRGKRPVPEAYSGSLREVFDYFADQLFDKFNDASQVSLMQMSYLPRLTLSMAVAVTGRPSAADLIEDLHHRGLFTDRRAGREPTYQFHALFQTFLRHRAEQIFAESEQVRIAVAAARILEDQGFREDAFPLYIAAGDTAAAGANILASAERLIAQGRWRIVIDSINALPESLVRDDCWLASWLGVAQIPVAPTHARPILMAGYDLAVREDDILCQIQSAAGVIQTYMLEYTHFRPMDPWIEILKAAVVRVESFTSVQWELRAMSALLIALSFRKPDDPDLEPCADRVFELLESAADTNLRAQSAAYLVAYGARTGPLRIARRAAALLQRLIAAPELSALTVGWGWWVLGFFHLIAGDEEACRRAVAESDRIGRDESLSAVSRFAAVVGAHVEMDAGNIEVAKAWSTRLEQSINLGVAYDRALSNTIKTFLFSMQGNFQAACLLGRESVELFDEAGVHHLCGVTRSQLAWALMLQGDIAAARRFAEEALQWALRARSEWVELDARIAIAAIALESGDRPLMEDNLRSIFALLRETVYVPTLRKNSVWAARLCAEALSIGIDPAPVRGLIRRLRLRPPSIDLEAWPWPVRVFVLGQFRVLVDGEPLAFSRKVPKKPISLLKALIAFGGRGVAMDRLVDAVWPDEEGDRAVDACWLSLHRLRKLLGTADAIHLVDGRMSLDPNLVWTDTGAFEQALSTASDVSPEATHLDRVLSLYKGDFLAGEPEAPWATPLRERLRGKFIHQLERYGLCLEELGQWDNAVSWYLRGIDTDPMAEAFYQGLMRCLRAQGRIAEAMSAYRRLRQTLSITLGIAPSPATEAVARALRSSP
ncbi:MAG: BTAD domain-containing putative transcriptional regulator [Burkholderiales bacterium]